jgi:hypothetical protein
MRTFVPRSERRLGRKAGLADRVTAGGVILTLLYFAGHIVYALSNL